MFDHVTIRVSDRTASERFFATVLEALAIQQTYTGDDLAEWSDFSLAAAGGEQVVTRNLHIAFVAPSRAHVDASWQTGVEAGSRDDGAPGERPEYGDGYYGAFLRDPDGNSIEAVHHGALREGGNVDHLWIRVADVAAATRFYATIASRAGLRVKPVDAERTRLLGQSGSFSVVLGKSTRNAHLAFPAPDKTAVAAFHRIAVDAGYRSNGAPGERQQYHPRLLRRIRARSGRKQHRVRVPRSARLAQRRLDRHGLGVGARAHRPRRDRAEAPAGSVSLVDATCPVPTSSRRACATSSTAWSLPRRCSSRSAHRACAMSA